MLVKITAKYDGKCKECREEIGAGDDVYFDTDERKVYCEPCGESLKD